MERFKPGCPKRWSLTLSSRYSKPPRPINCPCVWTNRMITRHLTKMMSEDHELSMNISLLLALFPDIEGV